MATGLLLINLGTPDAPTTPGGPPLPARVPLRPARDRHQPRRARAAAQPRHPADAPREIARPRIARSGMPERGSPLLASLEGPRRRGPGRRSARPGRSSSRCATAHRRSPTRSSALARRATRIVVLPLYPAVRGVVDRDLGRARDGARDRALGRRAASTSCRRSTPTPGFSMRGPRSRKPVLAEARADHVLFSFHGLPERQIKKSGDGAQCLASPTCCDREPPKTCYRAQCFVDRARARARASRSPTTPCAFSRGSAARRGSRRTPTS